MKEITLQEMHQLQLRMLDCIHEYCTKHNIRYSLGGGTLLGAIRHKGFIPWDDDVDIMMPRPDYERFLKGFPGKYEHCILQHWSTDQKYKCFFAKVYDDRTILHEFSLCTGVYIDVFPIDGLPPVREQKKYFQRYLMNYMLANIQLIPFVKRSWRLSIFAVATFPIRLLVPQRKLRERVESFLMSYDFETSECTGCSVGGYGMAEYMGRDTFKKYIEVKFENRSYRAIADYDEYLTLHYGDYMELPPIERRNTRHHFQCWWKDSR